VTSILLPYSWWHVEPLVTVFSWLVLSVEAVIHLPCLRLFKQVGSSARCKVLGHIIQGFSFRRACAHKLGAVHQEGLLYSSVWQEYAGSVSQHVVVELDYCFGVDTGYEVSLQFSR